MRYNLINERKRRSYSQAKLSKILGIGLRQYQRIEAGESDGKVKMWIQLSSILNDTIDNLLKNSNTDKEN